MIKRRTTQLIDERLGQFPAVALLGPRQVGKTTLARDLAAARGGLYLDLESAADRAKVADPRTFLAPLADRLVVLDEVHRAPDLFGALRGIIDEGRREGRRSGRFLLLGSASLDLLRQASESLAGRLAICDLAPLDVLEVDAAQLMPLWTRGGFPDSFLAPDERSGAAWRENFLRTYLERDVPMFGPRVPAETLRRFWTMLAHEQGGLLNASQFARALAVDGKTVVRYLDLLVDLLLVRRLPPRQANVSKRLVKSPRVYVRDSGLVHALLGLDDREAVLGHPVAGASWEGFVIENILRVAPGRVQASFYRTTAGAEMDLVLDWPGGATWAIEIKRSPAPSLGRGFHSARADLQPAKAFVVYGGDERYAKADGVEVIGVRDMCELVRAVGDATANTGAGT